MKFRMKLLNGLLLLGGCGWLCAQEVTSGIFGYYRLNLTGSSDTIVAIPFAQLPAATGLVDSTAGNVLNIQGSNSWTAGQFVYTAGVQSNHYYVRFESGALEGRQYDITNNGANSLMLNLRGDSLAGVGASNQVSVVPYWTFGTVFVNGNGIHPTTSPASRKTEVFLPNLTGSGINLSASFTYYYYTNAGSANWREIQSGVANRNDDIIPLNTYLIIRHNIPTNTTFVSIGDVVLNKLAIPLRANASVQQDNALGLARPIQLSLNDAGLMASGAFAESPSGDDGDAVIVFDNTSTNKNKSGLATYYYYNSAWRKYPDLITDVGTSNVLSPGAGFIIRKIANSTGPVWTNSPTY
jgi:uncharacterized protein (TIGR02597 family)